MRWRGPPGAVGIAVGTWVGSVAILLRCDFLEATARVRAGGDIAKPSRRGAFPPLLIVRFGRWALRETEGRLCLFLLVGWGVILTSVPRPREIIPGVITSAMRFHFLWSREFSGSHACGRF